MKKKLMFITLLATAFTFFSCNKAEDEIESRKSNSATKVVPVSLTKSQTDIVAAGSEFAFDFFRKMSAASGGKSVLVSPYSLQVALSMLANGAEDETYEEIVSALGWQGYDIEEINGLYQILTSDLVAVDKTVTLEVANSAWFDSIFPVKESFSDVLAECYDAEVQNIDFTSADAKDIINGWCSDKTHGMIKKMLEKVEPGTAFMLINALYFKGDWSLKFDSKKTGKDHFHSDSGKKKMDFLNDMRDCVGVNAQELQMCSLPYGGGAFSLNIILPAEGTDFDAFVADFDEERWKDILSKQRIFETTLSLPKFSSDYSSEDNIIPFLKGRGMNRVFNPDFAQLGKISDWDTFVSKVLQKTSFKMDETGSEAAAVTVVQGNYASSPGPVTVIETPYMNFNADRPFIYMIREWTSGTILFIGTYRG